MYFMENITIVCKSKCRLACVINELVLFKKPFYLPNIKGRYKQICYSFILLANIFIQTSVIIDKAVVERINS